MPADIVADEVVAASGAPLLAALPQAIYLVDARVSIGGWHPQIHRCHDNVRMWVEHNPQHRHALGFLFFDFGGSMPFARFSAHSAVKLEDGRLVDITPHGVASRYPFIRFSGAVEDYATWGAVRHVDVATGIAPSELSNSFADVMQIRHAARAARAL